MVLSSPHCVCLVQASRQFAITSSIVLTKSLTEQPPWGQSRQASKLHSLLSHMERARGSAPGRAHVHRLWHFPSETLPFQLAVQTQAVRKLYDHLRAAKEASVGRTLPVSALQPQALAPQAASLDQELEDAAQVVRQVRALQTCVMVK